MNTIITMGNCPQCGSSDVRKLASVYANGIGKDQKQESSSGTAAMIVDPPEKMANWTGWTLSILLWTPISWLVLFIAIQYASAGASQQAAIGPAAFVTAVIAGAAAWSIPGLMQRRRAHRYNRDVWAPAMKQWQMASVCLNCCKVYA